MVKRVVIGVAATAWLMTGVAFAGGKGNTAEKSEKKALEQHQKGEKKVLKEHQKAEKKTVKGGSPAQKHDLKEHQKSEKSALKRHQESEKRVFRSTHRKPHKAHEPHKRKHRTPPGWKKGRKVGWHGSRVPPGQKKK